MILNGNSRAGAYDLACHLLRDDENDHVHVHEVRGFACEDVHGAFAEARALAAGTKAKKYLYSLSLSPPDGANITAAEFEAAIDRVEQKLGLDNQPRTIIFHEKGDNRDRHAHAVWSRIDTGEMKAVPMPFHKMRLKEVSRELFIEHGWDMPRGLINREERNPLNYTFDQYQHAKRLGKKAPEIKADFMDAWAMSDNRVSFEHALQEKGFRLARGDKRGFLAVDMDGKEFSIPKWLDVKTKAVRERLGHEQDLRSLSETKAAIGRDMLGKMDEYTAEIEQRNTERKQHARTQRQALVDCQRQERSAQAAFLETRCIAEVKAQQARFRTGLKGVWDWVRGENKRISQENEADAAKSLARDTAEREKLIAQQRQQRQHLMQRLQHSRETLRTQHKQVTQDRQHYRTLANTPPEPARNPEKEAFKRARRATSEHKPRRPRTRNNGPNPDR